MIYLSIPNAYRSLPDVSIHYSVKDVGLNTDYPSHELLNLLVFIETRVVDEKSALHRLENLLVNPLL